MPLDPSRMISWHQALNAWPGWLILWFMSPTHTFNLQLTWSFSQVKVTFVSTFSSSQLQFHLFFTGALISVTAVFSPRDNLQDFFALCVHYQRKTAQKEFVNGTFQWHPHYFLFFIVSVSHSHNACYYSIRGWTVQEQDRKQSSACKIWPWKPLTYNICPQFFSTFTQISKMASGAFESAEICQSAEKSNLCWKDFLRKCSVYCLVNACLWYK